MFSGFEQSLAAWNELLLTLIEILVFWRYTYLLWMSTERFTGNSRCTGSYAAKISTTCGVDLSIIWKVSTETGWNMQILYFKFYGIKRCSNTMALKEAQISCIELGVVYVVIKMNVMITNDAPLFYHTKTSSGSRTESCGHPEEYSFLL